MFENIFYSGLTNEHNEILYNRDDYIKETLNMTEKQTFSIMEMIYVNEFDMNTIYNQIENGIGEFKKEELEQLIWKFNDHYNQSLSFIYQLPDLEFFQLKLNDYYRKYFKISQLVCKQDLSYINTLRDSLKKTIKFWESVLIYLKNNVLLNQPEFTTHYFFDLNLNFIDLFLKILKKSHLTLYFDQLKRYIALNPTPINIFELIYKLDFLEKYYISYKSDFILRQENEFINETYDMLIQLSLKSKKEIFVKSLKNENVTLEFIKSEGKKSFIYIIGFIFTFLSEIKDKNDNQIFKCDNVKFVINGVTKSFQKLKEEKNKNVQYPLKNNDEWINHIIPVFPQIEDWYYNSFQIFEFRPPLFIGNPF